MASDVWPGIFRCAIILLQTLLTRDREIALFSQNASTYYVMHILDSKRKLIKPSQLKKSEKLDNCLARKLSKKKILRQVSGAKK